MNKTKLSCYRIVVGYKKIKENPMRYPFIWVNLISSIYFLIYILNFNFDVNIWGQIIKFTLMIGLTIISILILLFLLIKIGTPRRFNRIQENLKKTGLKNTNNELPILLNEFKHPTRKHIFHYLFFSNGLSLKDFIDKRERIESALNTHILEIDKADTNNKIIITASNFSLSYFDKIIDWTDSYLRTDDFTLVLGETINNQLTLNISKTPHILIGGASGSGKSILLKLLIKQAINKNATVILADFKGGVDFPKSWHEQCNIILSLDELLVSLANLNSILEERKKLFYNTNVSNIQEYNIITKQQISRIIFACDEISEVLDKVGLTKENKEKVLQVESYLSIFARQGRAFGIHLILATQRPDANILNGQIKNNMSYRICGRADKILSSIILDDTIANTRIPKDSQGIFINQDNLIFQSYWFDDKQL